METAMSSPSSQLNTTILRAGAGAGKTTTLTQTFLQFASDFKASQGKFPRIVVTTFTRKATQELKERLLAKALADQREDLFQYVSSKSQVQISTIHGVLGLFLSRYGSAIGLTPDYKIMSESEIRKNARKIIRKYLLENPQLQELLEEYEFSILENALLTYFAEQVVFPYMKFIPEQELQEETVQYVERLSGSLRRVCVEISQETSNEKWQEYTQALSSFQWKPESGDWNSFFERLESFWEFTTKPIFRKASAPFSLSLHEELEDIRSQIDKLLEEPRFRPSFWAKHQKNCALFAELAASFCRDFMQTKLENGLLAMSDLETLAYKIVREAPEAAEKFSLEWDYWMVDEYQDTSPVQVELLRHLIGDRPQFVVGDPQQSIYLFRGARSEVFQEKVKEIESRKGDVRVQLVNYRSNPEVLEFFNHYFTRLSDKFAAMTPAPDKPRQTESVPVVQVLLSETAEEDEVLAETLNVVARIQELLHEGVNPEQICVLGRTHKTLEDIAKVAQNYGVPLQLHSGSGFYERREVLDALSILKFLLNPHDNANFVAVLRSPWLHLSDSEIVRWCHNGKHSYWREAGQNLETLETSHPLRVMAHLLSVCEEKGLSWTLKKALIELGCFDYSARIDSTGRREANLWKIIYLLAQEERKPGFNYLDFLDASLETLSTDEGGQDADATPVIEPKRVNFMTVHASKGLQFDQVIVPGMGQDPRASQAPILSIHETTGQWTLKVRIEETQSMAGSILADQINEEIRRREAEEFLRVLYVALTRAKKGVTLAWDKKVGKKSWAALCPLNLEEGLHEEATFSYVVRRDNLRPQKMENAELDHKQVRPVWPGLQNVEKLRSVSATELASQEMEKAETRKTSLEALGSGLARAQQGTNAHRLFEALKYSSYEDLLKITEPELRKPLEFIVKSSQIPLSEIISRGHVEWGFALRESHLLLQGQIDLWGLLDKTLWVVDYKTGSQRYSEVAFRQLEIYAWALLRMGYLAGVEKVQLAVVYPVDEVVKVQEVANLRELEKKIQEKLLSIAAKSLV